MPLLLPLRSGIVLFVFTPVPLIGLSALGNVGIEPHDFRTDFKDTVGMANFVHLLIRTKTREQVLLIWSTIDELGSSIEFLGRVHRDAPGLIAILVTPRIPAVEVEDHLCISEAVETGSVTRHVMEEEREGDRAIASILQYVIRSYREG
ncbi:MAG: hypothetical protein WCT24_01890 [Patescibacteria group bacterium]|jgi:hypothetical protein